ncbi:hypothetical protein NPIL_592061 [Nephila pilipes]|uniref:Uncharacterized protein n=1 Tax=Nephila pilipes TaxID=299642 RepID=A0A8X6MX29_NEPPI|nr:hypothetical protein NPIL_154051 [Nephila pilipes]GFT78642.1 hypothetical protein NPIL_592061 [Nephila pilipes]
MSSLNCCKLCQMQGRPPPYFSSQLRNHLEGHIKKGGLESMEPVACPPQFSDLNLCDFFQWDLLKPPIYATLWDTTDDFI